MQAALLQNGMSASRADSFSRSKPSADESVFKRTLKDAVAERAPSGNESSPSRIEKSTQRTGRAEKKRESSCDVDDSGDASDAQVSSGARESKAEVSSGNEKLAEDERSDPISERDAKVKSPERDEGANAEELSLQPAVAAALAAAEAVAKQPVTSDSAAPAIPQDAFGEAAPIGTEIAPKPAELASAETNSAMKPTAEEALANLESQRIGVLADDSLKATAKPATDADRRVNDLVSDMKPTDADFVEVSASAETGANSDPGADADAGSNSDRGSNADSERAVKLLAEKLESGPSNVSSGKEKVDPAGFDRAIGAAQAGEIISGKTDSTQSARIAQPIQLTPEQKFLQENVDQVVTSIRTQSASGGGQMNVRLDPPELGALQVAVKMIDGRLSASFTTSNDQATQLLSHSLQHLKSSLEASGINVDRIEVRQASPSEQSQSKSSNDPQQQNQRGFDSHSHHSEQHRKEMVQRMWRKIALGTDDLDLVA